ncbi:MAG: aminopeptidase P family protein [Ignavibacteria bacterium]|nr:aminopeptidase P family protein [Ignavibacteria bacterium]MBT8381753.1 aminopeptidase P family protein [Ignavibacteria bacterium]NNJ53987.1 aminopeptidase P family protein [Ignavibacteriaceae bacterium]NNL21578.1 aminopeptidase P family protein [Ignavibacteriaceae bacterium]
MFKIQTYLDRRLILKTRIESGIAIFMGNDESPMNYTDNIYHFRQDSSFLYYFGLNTAGLTGIIDFDEGKDYIFGNDLTVEDFVWQGYQPALKDQAQKAGVEYTGSLSNLEDFLKKAVTNGRKIHLLPQYRAENKLKLFHWLDINPLETNKAASVELIKAVVVQREIKSDEELQEIEKAVDSTVDMHLAAMRMVRPGILESEIAAKVQEIASKDGGNISFPTIATIHGETLHNHYQGNQLKEGDMFLLDCGAETAMGYAGDLSSTIPVSDSFTKRQREIYNITLASHNTSIEMLKPGMPFKDIYYQSCRILVEGLKELDLMKGDTEEALQIGAHAMFFPCGLGHQMGLDIHDMENLGEVYVGYDGKPKSKQFGIKSLRLAKPLKPGTVLTIEPGIYFIPSLIDMSKAEKRFTDFINYDKLETYKGFGGIRNEENFVITADGYKLLGKKKPKTIEDVEEQKKLGN